MHPEAALPLSCTHQQHLNCLICLQTHTALSTWFHRCQLIATHICTLTNMHTCTHAPHTLSFSLTKHDIACILSHCQNTPTRHCPGPWPIRVRLTWSLWSATRLETKPRKTPRLLSCAARWSSHLQPRRAESIEGNGLLLVCACFK